MRKLQRQIVVAVAAMMFVLSAACNDSGDSDIVVADEPYTQSFGEDGAFPSSLNVQIINGYSTGSLPPDPAILDCGQSFAVLAHNFSSPPTCDGFRDVNSPLVQRSVAEASGFISGLTCSDECPAKPSVVWRAWACGRNEAGDGNLASGLAIALLMCPKG